MSLTASSSNGSTYQGVPRPRDHSGEDNAIEDGALKLVHRGHGDDEEGNNAQPHRGTAHLVVGALAKEAEGVAHLVAVAAPAQRHLILRMMMMVMMMMITTNKRRGRYIGCVTVSGVEQSAHSYDKQHLCQPNGTVDLSACPSFTGASQMQHQPVTKARSACGVSIRLEEPKRKLTRFFRRRLRAWIHGRTVYTSNRNHPQCPTEHALLTVVQTQMNRCTKIVLALQTGVGYWCRLGSAIQESCSAQNKLYLPKRRFANVEHCFPRGVTMQC